MNEDLKPCPFCGGEAHFTTSSDGYGVECDGELCFKTIMQEHPSRAYAAQAWNARADEPQVIQNAEKYKYADDSGTKVIQIAEKYKFADKPDSRERLETDLNSLCLDCLGLGWNAANDLKKAIRRLLDRQAAITRAEVFEDGTFDCFTCGAKRELQERVDSLTAERDALKERVARFDSISNIDGIANLLVQFEDLTAERDQLQADLDACRMREKAAEDYDFREAAERWEQAFEDKCCEVVRLTAERDELKAKVDELTAERDELETKHERIVQEMVDANTRQCERTNELTAERDQLSRDLDADHALVVQFEWDNERLRDTCNTLRASVAGLKMTVERFKAREGA